jgi:hypothetical protein
LRKIQGLRHLKDRGGALVLFEELENSEYPSTTTLIVASLT